MKFRKLIAVITVASCMATLAFFPAVQAQSGTGDDLTPTARKQQEQLSRIIVKFKTTGTTRSISQQFDASGKASVQSLNERASALSSGRELGLRYLKTIHTGVQVVMTDTPLDRTGMEAVVARLAQDAAVESVEIDEKAYPHLTPNDSFFSQMWNLKSPAHQAGGANFELAWDRVIGASTPVNGAGVVVAVLDTGYRPHPDLLANLVQGYDFITADSPNVFTTANDGDGRDADATDPGDWNTVASACTVENSSWHGTHVAGTIAALGNNSTGVIGGAFGAKVLPVRVLGVCGGFSSDIQEGMYWAAGLHQINGASNPHVAKVINMSLGSINTCSTSYQNAVTAVINAGTTVVVSTGNDSSATTITSPANCNGVIAVTAHTSAGVNASYANIGTGTTISAPGSGIFSTDNTGTQGPVADVIRQKNGTSMAAPHVAAAAALLLQIKPSLTPAQIKSLLTSNARAFPAGSACTASTCGGLLDAFAAVKALQVSEGATANTAPSMTSAAAQTGTAGVDLQFDVTATDAEGDAVTFSNSTLPAGATLNAGTGRFRWSNPTLGTYTFTVTPSDTSRSGVQQTVTLSIVAPAASGGGGGGGSISAWEVCLLAVLAASMLLRRKLAVR